MSTQNSTQFMIFEEEDKIQVPAPIYLVSKRYQRWTVEQNALYINFLIKEQEMFSHERTRRSNRVFKMLSEKMGTKTQSQCKSHHQKMLKQHKNVQKMAQSVLKTAKKQGKQVFIGQEPEIDCKQEKSMDRDLEKRGQIYKSEISQMENIFDVLSGIQLDLIDHSI